MAIGVARELGPAAHSAVPLLARLVDDADENFCGEAMFALACIGRASTDAVRTLIKVVQSQTNPSNRRGTAAWASGRIGPGARLAGPALTQLLDHTNAYARVQAEIALRRLDGETDMVPRLISELENAREVAMCDRSLVDLKNSRRAIKLILEKLMSPDWKGRFGIEIMEGLRRMNSTTLDDVTNEPESGDHEGAICTVSTKATRITDESG